ncbi:MAG: carboxypeptidase-like regulatory domain-containing protein [Thermogutta sp.]
MRVSFLFACVAVLAISSQLVGAETQQAPTPRVIDVALQEGGLLLGQVVTPQGTPVADTIVTVSNGQQALGVAKTDAQGRFAFRGLQGGVYQLSAANGSGVYRLWAPRTAPPGAQQVTFIVSGQDLARGQILPRVQTWMRNPWIVGGAIATAIAVPIAVAEHEEEPSSP